MNFFKILLTLIFLLFSTATFSDNHETGSNVELSDEAKQMLEELEEDLLGITFNKTKAKLKSRNIPRSGIKSYATDVRTFIMQVIAEKKVEDLEVWQVAQAYVLLLTGDNRSASIALRKVVNSTEDSTLKDQVEIFLLAQIIDAFEIADEQTENLAYALIRNNSYFNSNKSHHQARWLSEWTSIATATKDVFQLVPTIRPEKKNMFLNILRTHLKRLLKTTDVKYYSLL